jgi:transglutaminase-like putative cysteine protease
MTAAELRARVWCGAACALAQIAATAAGMVPWWALPFTLALTVAVSQPSGPVNAARARLTRGAGVASVAAFASIIAVRTINQGRQGIVDPTATLRSLSEALVVLSLIMAPSARTPREHRVWLTVTTGVLVAAAAGGRTLSDGAFAITAWIVVLVATNKVQVTDAYAGGAVPAAVIGMHPKQRFSLVGRADATIPIISALVAGAIVFLALPAGLGGAGLVRQIERSVQQANLALANRADVGVDTHGFGDLSLLVRGTLPDTPLLRVPLDSPPLWRATFYRTYTGTSWENFGPGETFVPTQVLPGPTVNVPATTDDPPAIGGVTRTDRVEVEPAAHADLIWAPGVPVRVSGTLDQVREVVRGSDNVRVFGTPGQATTSYQVTTVVPPTRSAVLTAARGAGPRAKVWTSLPPSLPPEVTTLAHRVTAGATTRYAVVTDIERYLAGHERYSLAAPIPPRGKDAVDEFLFHTHIGFCELFASAEAVMLRTLGVPARVVSGLAYGARSGSTRLYTAANAHAWVEIYYPGVGWSPSDPTAGVTLLGASKGGGSVFSRVFNDLARVIPGGRLAVAVIGALMLVGLGWFVRRAVRDGDVWRRRRNDAVRPPGPVLAAFLRMAKSRAGPPPRAASETARQYLARVGGVRPDVGAAVVALEQELYGEAPPTDAEIRAAVETFDSLVAPTR